MLVQPPEVIRGKIDPCGDVLRSKRVENLLRDVAVEGSMHNAKWSRRRIEHGKAGVVLGGEHHVTNACEVRQPRPVQRIKRPRVEGLRQLSKESIGVLRRCACQRMADDHAQLAIYTPVNK